VRLETFVFLKKYWTLGEFGGIMRFDLVVTNGIIVCSLVHSVLAFDAS
jgi:hypothetical protein